eukprot:g3617.t1
MDCTHFIKWLRASGLFPGMVSRSEVDVLFARLTRSTKNHHFIDFDQFVRGVAILADKHGTDIPSILRGTRVHGREASTGTRSSGASGSSCTWTDSDGWIFESNGTALDTVFDDADGEGEGWSFEPGSPQVTAGKAHPSGLATNGDGGDIEDDDDGWAFEKGSPRGATGEQPQQQDATAGTAGGGAGTGSGDADGSWVQQVTPDGHTFYFNTITRHSTWRDVFAATADGTSSNSGHGNSSQRTPASSSNGRTPVPAGANANAQSSSASSSSMSSSWVNEDQGWAATNATRVRKTSTEGGAHRPIRKRLMSRMAKVRNRTRKGGADNSDHSDDGGEDFGAESDEFDIFE